VLSEVGCLVAVLLGCDGRPLLHARSTSVDARSVDGQSSAHSSHADAAREIGSTGTTGLDASTDYHSASSSSDATPDRPSGAGADAAPTLDALAPDTRDATGPVDVGVPQRRPRVLTNVLTGAPWFGTQAVLGMAVDAQNRVYLADGQNVYTVTGQTVSVYLTAAEAAAGLNLAVNEGVGSVDLDENGLIYVVAGGISNAAGIATFVLRSSAPHIVEIWRDISSMDGVERVAVVSAGHVAVVGRDGMRTFSDTGNQLVYSSMQLSDTEGCATQDLKAAPSGVFLYQPGCNGSPLLRGNVDGSGVGVLYEGASLRQPASNFLCSSRDPSGGFYFLAERADDYSPQLYHVSEDASGLMGLEVIDTEPTFLVAKKTQTETYGFDFCSLAAARDGTVFLQTYSQLWKVSP
jgi:hypothetical protein